MSGTDSRGSGRREFLRLVVVGGGVLAGMAAASSGSAAPAAKAGGTGAVGIVESADSARLVLRTSTGSVTVTAAADARLYSGSRGQVHDLGDFVVGDRIAVEGTVRSGVLLAHSAGSIFEPLQLSVGQVDASGALAETDHGPVRLDGVLPFSQPSRRVDPAGLATAHRITGLSWRDPQTGARYLLVADAVAA